MLRRVVFENYKIFPNKHTVDFTGDSDASSAEKLFILVGENGSGKSTLATMIGLASNFNSTQQKRNLRPCDRSKESFVACEYSFEKLEDLLPCTDEGKLKSIHPDFKLWFLDGLLKIPKELYRFLRDNIPGSTPGIDTSPLLLFIGFRRRVDSDPASPKFSNFLFVKSADRIVAVVKPFDESALVGSSAWPGDSFIDTIPNLPAQIQLQATNDSFLGNDDIDLNANPSNGERQAKIPKMDDSQVSMILQLRNRCAAETRDAFWNSAVELFHQLTGDKKITVKYQSGGLKIVETLDGVDHVKLDLPEGFFYALIVALLVVNPLTKTLLLDEPTRGMHPLQIRRLRRILSQESSARKKVVIVTSHSPDFIHGSPIHQIFRFRRLPSGFSEIHRVSSEPSEEETRFIGSAESRDLFFTRRVIWVEGDTDRRICEVMLKMIDKGDETLFKALLNRAQPTSVEPLTDQALKNLFATPVYQKQTLSEDYLKECQEKARSCGALSLDGSSKLQKAVNICRDLAVPYVAIVDLDALLPFDKKELKQKFNENAGDWEGVQLSSNDSLRTPEAGCCVQDQDKREYNSCVNADQVIKFHEKKGVFAWQVYGGTIEDVAEITRGRFKKKRWKGFSVNKFEELIHDMLEVGTDGNVQNPEMLRCFHFILKFLQSS